MCQKDDLLGGTFELQAMLELIGTYCDQVIVMFTKAFMDNPDLLFFATHAQMKGVKGRMRSMIPCLYDNVVKADLPDQFQYYGVLRHDDPYFWNKLEHSITSLPTMVINHRTVSQRAITEPARMRKGKLTSSSIQRASKNSLSAVSKTSRRIDTSISSLSDSPSSDKENETSRRSSLSGSPVYENTRNWILKELFRLKKMKFRS